MATLRLPEENQSLVDNVSPSPSNQDLFKHENDSVDMLLKEMNLDPAQLIDSHDASSIFNSPTKPLNFPRSISKPIIEPKESPASGSDTCASDDADEQANNNKVPNTSFDRNFNLDDSSEVQKTIGKPELDEFSFQTPITSTTNLLDDKTQHEKQQYQEPATPSSKSIMKKNSSNQDLSSPKKAVAFTNDTPEIHQYTEVSTETSHSEHDIMNDQIETEPVNSEWNELQHSNTSEENDLTNTPPPPPPPHTSSTFNDLVNSNANANDDDDPIPEHSELTGLKLKHGNFSNLSLNEKLDLYLSTESNTGKPYQEMDTHLHELDQAAHSKTNDNIQDLSFSIQTPQKVIENPMYSLKSPDVQLHSGSSQSSLTSLRDDNRKLHMRKERGKRNSGIQLNDGIKGLSDDLVELLIPDNTKELIVRSPSFGIHEEFNDSFDKSYNHTEQSILNLLNSTSKSYDLDHLSNEANSEETIVDEKEQAQDEKEVKSEFEPEIESDHSNKAEPSEEINVHEEIVKKENGEVPVKSEIPSVHVSMHTGLTPQEEVDQLREQKPNIDDGEQTQDSITSENLTKMSIKFHMDSDWKLEDSNDGDREDNDTTQMDDTTHSDVLKIDKDEAGNSSSESFQDASDILAPHTLAPPRFDEAVDATNASAEKTDQADTSSENVLANSSNVAPPEEITLPVVEPTNYSSFEEITKNMDSMSKSYEDLLSAEHDVERKSPNIDFISIWHKHEKEKKHGSLKLSKTTSNASDYKMAMPEFSSNHCKIPSSLQTKKFKEVHVMSRKIVNPDFEDLHMSGFLPEISEDSGFDDLKLQASAIMARKKSNQSLSTRDVLANMDNDPHVIEPPQPDNSISTAKILAASVKLRNRDSNPPHGYPPQPPPSVRSTPQISTKSRFRVPTFEIKRSTSALAPHYQYNELFEDVTPKKPTIRADGMKTLPSMDKDDVKRILNAKKIITQDDYARVKLAGPGRLKKNSVVDEPDLHVEDVSQQASYHDHNSTQESSEKIGTNSESSTSVLPYLADELKKSPQALLADDKLFKDNEQEIHVLPQPISAISPNVDFPRLSLEHTPQQNSASPISSEFDIDVSPQAPPQSSYNPFRSKREETPEPKPKKTPIKIGGSPIKLVKRDGMVTGIEVDHLKTHMPEFTGDELVNSKLRDRVSREIEKEAAASIEPKAPYKSRITSVHTLGSRGLPSPEIVDNELPDGEFMERGKLFFRVIGIKNIELPDLSVHKNAKFSITLDNGVHCIRTPDYDLNSRKVPIGKEFELTVGDSLEFILTMKATYDKPKDTLVEVTERKTVKPKNRLSRLLGQKDIITTTKFVPKQAANSWGNKFANDGSFARCYIDLAQFEDKVTGKALNFDLNCFNEWETSEDNSRRPAYKIAQLEVKMLFVPRSDAHEILPTSIRSAYESVNELCRELDTYYEGYLHQEGGDCSVWKRRFFKLRGASLIAHSEYNHKTRAKINLSKIVDVIYVDKENINPGSSSSNYRNFSDVLLLEHAFKIRFADGEIIDFGAPNKEQKRDWVRILEQIVYRNRFRRQPWVNIMMQAADLVKPKQIPMNGNGSMLI